MANTAKTLAMLIDKAAYLSVKGDLNISVTSIESDSRAVTKGALFVAVRGTVSDGHQYIPEVIEKGAVALICEEIPKGEFSGVTFVVVKDSSETLGLVASSFFDEPSTGLRLIGVTGTNGKTSVTTLLFQIFKNLGYRCGLISTVQYQIQDEILPATHTTPDALTTNELLRKMKKEGCTHVFMEVSSHAAVQNRIMGLTFAGGIFTNITHDHLDFHGTFDHYIAAKKKFFDMLPKGSFALVNSDDRRGSVMIQNTKAAKNTYSLLGMATFKGKLLAESLQGTQMEIDGKEVWLMLIGRFNAYNALAAYGAAVLLGEPAEEVLKELSGLMPPQGRFQQFHSTNNVTAIVDYAHTPDALQNVLETIEILRKGNEQVITVIGCGGNRDATKRPKMAEIACKLSDKVILTSDNPRFEDPNEIIMQMEKGVSSADYKKVKSIVDRREAINHACKIAAAGDIILIAGKGHETYQEINGVKHHFDDREVLRVAFEIQETN